MSNEKKAEVDVLDELNKGACMGMDAIKFVLDKVEDENFYNLLEKQYNGYKIYNSEGNQLILEQSNIVMDEISKITGEAFGEWFDTLDDDMKSFALMCLAVSIAQAIYKSACQIIKKEKEKKK